mgnify:CR=1 FL=1
MNKNKPLGVPFRGRRLRRQRNMIYWWSWGSTGFDIRNVRQVLGQPREHKEDVNISDRCSAHDRIVDHLDKLIGERNFKDVLKQASVVEDGQLQ